MNKQGITKTKEGFRTTGIEQFFDDLPDYIIPVQKCEPPYMSYADGYGYLGVLLLDTDKDRIQCHICGRWYKALGRHLTVHNINANEYKDKVSLYRKEPLMSLKTMYKFRDTNTDRSRKNLAEGIKMIFGRKLEIKAKERHGSSTVQFKNRYGTCDAQLKFRLDQAVKKHGKIPTTDQEPTLANTLRRRHGSWAKALEIYGYSYIKTNHNVPSDPKIRIEKETLIAPKCKICGLPIERKEFPSGLEDRTKWLNKKTCSEKCLYTYINSKVTFRGCIVEGCRNTHKAKGYCISHYLKEVKVNRNH